MNQESKIIVGYSRDELKKINYNPVTLEKQPDETVQQTQEQNSLLKPAVPITNISQQPSYSNNFQNISTQPTNNTQFQNFQQSKTFGTQQNQFQQQTPQFQNNNVQFQNFMNSNSQQKFQPTQPGQLNQQFTQQSDQFQPKGFQSGFQYKDNFYPK